MAGVQIAGAIVEAVGGTIKLIGGLFGTSKKAKAAKYRRKAAAVDRQMVEKTQAVQRRDLIRNLRAARAQAMSQGASESGGTRSSGTQGVSGSLASQSLFNLDFFEGQAQKGKLKYTYEIKADKYESKANEIIAYSDLIGTSMQEAGRAMQSMGGGMGGGMGK